MKMFEMLRGSPILRSLSEQEINALAGICREKRFAEGAAVFLENMPGESLYIIREGTIKISRMFGEGEEEILVILGPEDIFGEMALLDGGPRTASARVAEAASLLVIRREDFESLCEQNPPLGLKLMRNLIRVLLRRLRETGREYREMLAWALGRES